LVKKVVVPLLTVAVPKVIWVPPLVVEYAKVTVPAVAVPATDAMLAVRVTDCPWATLVVLADRDVVVTAAPTVSEADDEVDPAFKASPL
jgi:alpha/beta superfamily hydrolase